MISYRGRSQILFIYFFPSNLFCSSPVRSTFPQTNQAEIISVCNLSNFHKNYRQQLIQHNILWSSETQHNHA